MPQDTPPYRADIDGLRALAVVAVVLFHARVPGFDGGFVGVDVFFVISGYLITGLIVPPIAAGTFSVLDFYARRVRRLFPALFVLLLLCCVPAYWLLLPEELEDFGQSVATTALFSSNFLFFSEAGYFAGPAETKPLLHTWSLAIEEQFYLLFPGLLLLLARWRVGFVAVTGLLFAASLLLSMWSGSAAPTAGFYLLPSRAWELLLGALLALAPPLRLRASVAQLLGLSGLACIAGAVVLYSSTTEFPGAAALLPCSGAALVVLSGQRTATWVSRSLSLRPIVFIGLISYSLYLWHWPLLVFARHYYVRELSAFETSVVLLLAFALAVCSWRCVEQPFRGAAGLLQRRVLFRVAGGVMLALIGVGVVYDETQGLPRRLPQDVAAVAAVGEDKPAERKRCEGIAPQAVSYARLCRIAGNDAQPSFVFWGDSHASALMRAVAPAARKLYVEGVNASFNGCPPLIGVANQLVNECIPYHQAVVEVIGEHPQLKTVLLLARWARYVDPAPYRGENGELIFLHDAQGRATDQAENLQLLRRGAQRTLAALSDLQRRVVILGPIPEVGADVPSVMAKALWRTQPLHLVATRAAFNERQRAVLALFHDLADQYTNVTFVPVHDLFCDSTACEFAVAGLPLYFDGDHLAGAGAARFEPLFEALLRGE